MSHIVESCPLTELIGGLSRLHSADEDAVSWLTSYLLFMTHIREEGEECIAPHISSPSAVSVICHYSRFL